MAVFLHEKVFTFALVACFCPPVQNCDTFCARARGISSKVAFSLKQGQTMGSFG